MKLCIRLYLKGHREAMMTFCHKLPQQRKLINYDIWRWGIGECLMTDVVTESTCYFLGEINCREQDGY